MTELAPTEGRQAATRLTPRQAEVLALLAEGLTREQVAARMGIQLQTVKNYLTVAYERLDVQSLVQAFGNLGWLDVPPDATGIDRRRHRN